MARTEGKTFGPRQGGYMIIYCTKGETEVIADAAGGIKRVCGIFSAFVEPTTLAIIGGMAAFLSWKAKRCLARGKLLKIEIGPFPIPGEYEP